MPPLYPKMRERPMEFRMNYDAPLAKGLVFAGLGGHGCVGSMVYPDSSLYGNHGRLVNMDPTTDWVWSPELGRWGLDYVGTTAASQYTSIPMTGTHSALTIAAIANIRAVTGTYDGIVLSRVGSVTGLNVLSASAIGYHWNSQYYNFSGPAPVIGGYALYAVSVAPDKASLYVNNTSAINVASHGPTSPALFRIADDANNEGTEGRYLNGTVYDVMVWSRALSPSEISALAELSNVDLRVGGVPLILPPRRRLWPVSVVHEAVYLKRRNLGLRTGSREVVI